MNSSGNPWLSIPAQDYEAHMASPEVGQLQFLNMVFRETMEKCRPASLLVPGCATGNGFEHIDPAVTTRIVAVDINPDYLMVLRERFPGLAGSIETLDQDILACKFEPASFDLIFTGLIFEYLDAAAALERFRTWLKKDGILVSVLQLPDERRAAVTPTRYASLERLAPVMRLMTEAEFDALAARHGLARTGAAVHTLASGKRMYVASHVPRSA